MSKRAVAILPTLLYLGIKDIRLGPSLPALISPGVLDVLVKNFSVRSIITPDEDLKVAAGFGPDHPVLLTYSNIGKTAACWVHSSKLFDGVVLAHRLLHP